MVRFKRSKAPANPAEPPKVVGKRKRTEVQTKECVICFESKPLYRNFPAFSSCSHGPETCSSCVAKQTVTLLLSISGKGWSVCRCPQCDVRLPEEELQGALPRALVKEMKEMVNRALDSADESWRWCLAAGCGHGGLHGGGQEMIRCRKCDYKMCLKHQVPWHTGYTCQEYETSHPHAAITKTSEELVQKVSKPCPGCGIAVQKDGGCNHMSCEQHP
jgi:IBR domain, a half RING-finger domain